MIALSQQPMLRFTLHYDSAISPEMQVKYFRGECDLFGDGELAGGKLFEAIFETNRNSRCTSNNRSHDLGFRLVERASTKAIL